MSYTPFSRDVLPASVQTTIFNAMVELSQHRPLNRAEIRLRCTFRPPGPWKELGISPSTYYRRLKRERLAAIPERMAA